MSQPPAESPFLPNTFTQFAWDSTSLGLFKECPRKYLYTMIRGFRPKGESVHLTFGIWYHSALEHYDKRRAAGDDHQVATRAALLKVMSDSWVNREALPSGEPAMDTGHPWESDHPLKTRPNLIRSILWYLDEFEHDKAQTVILANGQAAVELSFRFRVSDDLVLCGHLDRLVNWMDGIYVMDRKTSTTTLSSYYFDQYEPDNQMSLYTLGGRLVYNTPVRGVVIDAAQIAVGFTRFDRGLTYRSEAQLEEWLDATRTFTYSQADMAEQYLNRIADGERYPERAFPQNDKSCQKFGGCPYRRICSKSPEVREVFLQTDYEVSHWNPLQPR
jgi:hypothetical protein